MSFGTPFGFTPSGSGDAEPKKVKPAEPSVAKPAEKPVRKRKAKE